MQRVAKKDVMNQINFSYMGNVDIWNLPKTAFLCSDKYSASSVLKSYDWAVEMKKQGRCVISGFQSKIEKDVFEILLKGNQPIIWALSRSIYAKPPTKYTSHIEASRLLIISQFQKSETIPHSNRAFERNQYIINHADEIVIAHITPGGKIEKLLPKNIKQIKILDLGE